MHIKKDILSRAFCVGKGVLEGLRIEKAGGRMAVVASCRPRKGQECRCPECGRKASIYDHARQPRRWRTMDIGTMPAYIEYRPVRAKCPEHGVVTASVPWAEPGSRFTRVFEDQVAWLAVHCSMKAVSELMRIDWHTVGGICRRAERRLEGQDPCRSRFDGLVRIGIDETSYKKGHKYLTVIVDHDRGCVIWCGKGYGKNEPCQYNGQWDPRFYAASIISGSYARALSKRSKNSSIAFAGTRSPMDSCGR